MPTKRASPCVLQTGGKLVALGGISTTQQPLNVVEVYDPAEREWTQQDVMKDHLNGMSGVVRGTLQLASVLAVLLNEETVNYCKTFNFVCP